MSFIANFRLEIDWWIQNHLTASPAAPGPARFDLVDFDARLDHAARQRLIQLSARYSPRAWTALCDADTYHINLYTLDICDRYLGSAPAAGRGLDIGCKDWDYLPALASWSGLAWDGVEIDAHRRHINLVTRRACGERMAAAFPGSRYLAGSVTGLDERYSLITWFLPFVLPAPLRAWRLPDRLFQPTALLAHTYGLLQPGGRMLIVNQGETEAAAQQRLFSAQGIAAEALGPMESALSPFTQQRYGWLVTRPT